MKNRFWIILFSAVIVVSGAIWFIISQVSHEVKIARIYQDGNLIKEVDLTAVAQPYSFIVTGEDGDYNIIYVEPDRISVSGASCPDQICVNHSPISDGIEPIVCLPNRVLVRIESSAADGPDGVTGG